jgi:hypothetical protein
MNELADMILYSKSGAGAELRMFARAWGALS